MIKYCRRHPKQTIFIVLFPSHHNIQLLHLRGFLMYVWSPKMFIKWGGFALLRDWDQIAKGHITWVNPGNWFFSFGFEGSDLLILNFAKPGDGLHYSLGMLLLRCQETILQVFNKYRNWEKVVRAPGKKRVWGLCMALESQSL